MKFGLFYELSVPRPWTRESERTVYQNALEQVRLADELGFDQVWAVEHHFLEEYSHCPAPELFLTACAMIDEEDSRRPRHRHLRPGVQPSDQDRGAHRGARHPLGRPPRGRHRSIRHLDRARRLPRQSGHHEEIVGRVRALPAEDVDAGARSATRASSGPCRSGRSLPKVYQRPHPPLWVAVTSPGTELDAADRGLGSLGLTFGQFAEQEKRIAEYRRRIQLLRAGRRIRQRPGQHGELPVLPRGRRDGRRRHRPAHGRHLQLPRRAADLGARGYSPAARTSRSASCRSCGARRPGPTPPSRRARARDRADPERVIDALKRWEAVGVDRVNFLLNAMEVDPAGGRARQPAALRQGGHARVRGRQAGRQRAGRERLMPTFGTLELTRVVDRLPTMRDLDTEAWPLPGAEILQLAFEVPRATESLLPRAMHPAIPAVRDDLGHPLSRESGRPVHSRAAPAHGTRGSASAGFVLRRGREHGRSGDRPARTVGPAGGAGAGRLPAPARPHHRDGDARRADGARLRADRSRADLRRRRAVHPFGDARARPARREDRPLG